MRARVQLNLQDEAVGFDPSKLGPDSRVRLPGHHDAVSLVRVTPVGRYWDVEYRTDEGHRLAISLEPREVDDIEVVSETPIPTFTGDPRRFRLGVEALRIQNAARHDMTALAMSCIDPLPHQLEAVYDTFLDEPRLRFLLADDPGAGKTIMTGLYVKELQLRRALDRLLVVTPASLRPQWQRELAERFGIDCIQLDRAVLNASPTVNPWDTHDVVIVSRDFLSRREIAESFEAAERPWDLAVVDEAHGFTLQVDGKGLITKRTERYKAAERIAAKAHRLILLTATPHSGKTESLWGLLRLLDADAYGDRCPRPNQLQPSSRHYRKVPKEKMRDLAGRPLFKPRHPNTVGFDLERSGMVAVPGGQPLRENA